MSHELPKRVAQSIERLSAEGDALTERGDDDAAIAKYVEAWNLIPEDKENWEASTWLLTAVGEIFFRRRNWEKSLNSYLRAVQCPTGLGNPYVHLRIGQLQYELGKRKEAGDNLARAYMGAGDEIFVKEDPKYLSYLRTILRPPERGGE